MKKLSILICVFIVSFFTAQGVVAGNANFKDEQLHYVITYKWGAIHKDAGTATLSLKSSGNDYFVTLTAASKPWADKIFMVRDTLTATIDKKTFRAKQYVKAAHEGGKFSKDIINYSYSGNNATGKATRIRVKKGKRTTSNVIISATAPVYDMLSIFYYLRCLDYISIASGQVVRASVFSGSKCETITIRPIGKETIKLRNNKSVSSFHLKFNFTTKGKKKSSDDMNVWISDDSRHIPLLLVGNLPIGQVRCYYVN